MLQVVGGTFLLPHTAVMLFVLIYGLQVGQGSLAALLGRSLQLSHAGDVVGQIAAQRQAGTDLWVGGGVVQTRTEALEESKHRHGRDAEAGGHGPGVVGWRVARTKGVG